MAERKTNKAGIPKIRQDNIALQRTLDAIIERLEVLDGIRGDALDQAVTYRDLALQGFSVIPSAGADRSGTPQIIDTPGPGTGDGPGIGPAAPPNTLTASETFLALLISWNNPSFNLQHLQIWRADVDNLSLAVMIGTTVSTKYMDYVGANANDGAGYYYWARSVGTDGTLSAFNDTAGAHGVTGIDPGDFSIASSGFTVTDSVLSDISPFVTGTVTNPVTDLPEAAIALDGHFIVTESIRGGAIFAKTIGAGHIDVTTLSALSADMGTLRSGRITTGTDGTAPLYDDQLSYRVEIENVPGTVYPIWYGSGPKAAAGGRFYVDKNGRVTINGLLDAGMIKQSYFTPADGNNTMRIACEFYSDPSTYSGGEYTGNKAHINPILTTGYNAVEGSIGTECYDRTNYNTNLNLTQHRTGWHSTQLILYSPSATGGIEYGRLGSFSENISLRYSVTCQHAVGPPYDFWLIVKYQYDSEPERFAFIQHLHLASAMRTGSIIAEDIFITRNTSWSTLRLRIGVGCRRSDEIPGSVVRGSVSSANLTLTTQNMGYADLSGIINTTSPTDGSTVPLHDPDTKRRYQ